MKRIIDSVNVHQIKGAEYNPRTITAEAERGLKASMDRFGNIAEITWNKTTGNLATGHHRYFKLLNELKDLTFKPVTHDHFSIEGPRGPTGFFLRVVEWTIEEEQAANVAANNPHIQGTFDEEKLKAVMENISKGIDASAFEALQFVPLVASNEWQSDIEPIAATTESLDSMVEKLIIECPKGQKEAVRAFLSQKLEESSFEDVTVR